MGVVEEAIAAIDYLEEGLVFVPVCLLGYFEYCSLDSP
jgi:hypothetical protein